MRFFTVIDGVFQIRRPETWCCLFLKAAYPIAAICRRSQLLSVEKSTYESTYEKSRPADELSIFSFVDS